MASSSILARAARAVFPSRLHAASRLESLGRSRCVAPAPFDQTVLGSTKVPSASGSPFLSSILQRFGISSAASPELNKDQSQSPEDDNNAKNEQPSEAKDSKLHSGPKPHPEKRRRTIRTAFSDSDMEPELSELSKDELMKLVIEKEKLLRLRNENSASLGKRFDEQIKEMKEKVAQSYAEMESVIDRTKREADNSKRFAVQSFAKSLLDVADNLSRASSVVKESFSKINTSRDSAEAAPLLKTLLEGVEMTEKQLSEVFQKFGVEKFDPVGEVFDPNRHFAVFQVPDPSKPPGTVAAVTKVGYMLHDRVLRPAEVGVVPAAEA